MAFANPEVDVGVAEALPQLLILAGLLVAAGLIYLADAFVRAIFGTVSGTVGWIPYVGKLIESPVDSIAQKVSNAMGAAEAKIDNQIGVSFHKLAGIVVWLAEMLIALPLLVFDLGKLVGELLHRTTAGEQVAQAVTGSVTAVDRIAVHGIDRIRAAEASALHGIDTLGGRVGIIEQEIQGTLDPTLEALRARQRELEDGFQRAWELIKAHEEALGLGALTGAVAIALDELGGSWIRCETNKLIGRKLCGSNLGLLKDLLEGALLALTVADLCALTKGMIALAESSPVQDTLRAFTDGLDDLLLCQGVDIATPLPATTLSLGPLTQWGTVAAASV